MKQIELNRLLIQLSLLSFALIPTVGRALDYETRFQLGVMDYEYEQKPITLSNGDKNSGYKLGSIMPFAGGGITVFKDKLFFDLYLQKAVSGSDQATLEFDEADDSSNFSDENIDSDFDREEYSLSLGYTVGSQGALFIGYRESTTYFDESSDEHRKNRTITNIINLDFKQQGYFLGGVYAFPVSEQTVITLSAALAFLDGEYNFSSHSVGVSDNGEGTPSEHSFANVSEGDTKGLNLGVTWKGRLSERLDYTLGLNGYKYDFDFQNVDSGRTADPKLAESVTRLSTGLSYRF